MLSSSLTNVRCADIIFFLVKESAFMLLHIFFMILHWTLKARFFRLIITIIFDFTLF
jgi:hypothetical protein